MPRFDWHAPEGENPYAGLLALADRFVVTGDSISMQVEVARLAKPLEILPLPTGGLGWLDHARRQAASWLFRPPQDGSALEAARIALARALFRLRLMPQTRHFPRFHQTLIDRGLASWIGEGGAAIRADTATETDADMVRILARIDALLPREAR
jgi:hypothetical protein